MIRVIPIQRKYYFYFVIIALIYICLLLMERVYYRQQQALESLNHPEIPMILMSVLAFIIGILIEWDGLKNVLQLKFKINFFLIPFLLITLLSFIPQIYWVFWVDEKYRWFTIIFQVPQSHVILNVLSGILLVRILSNKKDKS